MRIILVRHGESEANVDMSIYERQADSEISLTDKGFQQAGNAGKFLRDYFLQSEIRSEISNTRNRYEDAIAKRELAIQRQGELLGNLDKSFRFLKRVAPDDLGDLTDIDPQEMMDLFPIPEITIPKPSEKPIRILSSEYKRAIQTADTIAKHLGDMVNAHHHEAMLAEKDFGLFAGNGEENPDLKNNPVIQALNTYNNIMRQTDSAAHYATHPFGESDFDVSIRVKHVIDSMIRDNKEKGIDYFVVVCHGKTARVFAQQFMNFPASWINATPNPENCEMWEISNNPPFGYGINNGKWNIRTIYSVQSLENAGHSR